MDDYGGSTTYDVIIVGGGLSGLSAAYYMLKKDETIKVLVLEAKDRVGGRTLTTDITCASGTSKWDVGGQWVGRTQSHIMSLLDDLGLDTFTQFTDGRKVVQVCGDGRVAHYQGFFPALSLLSLYGLARALYVPDRLSQVVDVEDPYSCAQAKEWDSTTVGALAGEITHNSDARSCLDLAVNVAFGSELCQVPVLYYLFYGRCAGGFEPLYQATEGSGQELKIKGGAQQVSELLWEKIGKDNVKLNSPVQKIDQVGTNVVVTTLSGSVYAASRVILAAPPQYTGRIEYTPPLPEERVSFLNHMPMAHLNKFIVTYKTAFWRQSGYSGESLSSGKWSSSCVDELKCEVGPVSITYDATDHTGNPALVGFYAGEHGLEWGKRAKHKRIEALLKHLAELFDNEQALEPLDVAEKFWYEEPYTGGCPISVPHTGYMQHFNTALREPYCRLHWAGTESATSWCGFMNGAVQAGIRAAYEVLHNLNPGLLSAEEYEETYYAMAKRSRKRRGEEERRRKSNRTYRRIGQSCLILGAASLGCYLYVRYRR